MSDSPWFKFYASDFLAGVGGLSAAERGVYITILSLIYEEGGPVPLDEARLARRCGIPTTGFRRAFAALVEQGKLRVEENSVTNRRAEKEVMTRRLRSENARSSAHQRWNAEAEKSPQNQGASDANASGSQCAGDAMPEARSQKPDNSSSSRREALDPGISDDQLLDEVVAAAGLPGGRLTSHWLPPTSTLHVSRWRRDLGLSAEEIVQAIRKTRAQHGDPPNGPKAYDRMLANLAAQKAAPPMAPAAAPKRPSYGPKVETQEERIARWNKIGRGGQ